MLLADKRIVVTGGATGIGRSTVLAMVREGAQVCSMSRSAVDSERVQLLFEEAQDIGSGGLMHLQVDVEDQDQVNASFDKVAATLGGIDALVHSAGIQQQKPTELLTADDFTRQFDHHVLGTVFTNLAAFRHMKARGGSIVNSGSAAGVIGRPSMAAYSVAKAGVIVYTRVIAQEWGRYGIRANIVCPLAKSDMYNAWEDEQWPERKIEIEERKRESIPLGGDFGMPQDTANLHVFLASDRSSYMTGQMIAVDGGMVMGR